jgi:RNA polymerase sigma factor (sigma-70 family)
MTQKPQIAPVSDRDAASDPELISLVRTGDMEAYEALFARHREVAMRVARRLDHERAEDICSEAFVKILDLLQRGKGPDAAFRPYLLTTVRTVHLNFIRARKRESVVADDDLQGLAGPVIDDAEGRFDEGAIARAFRQLPERWQSVLWMTTVEGMGNEAVSQHLGIEANAVSSLAFRARAGLRQAYLSEHLLEGANEECSRTVDLLPRYLRGTLSLRRRTIVIAHLDGCAQCSLASVELADVDRRLGALLGPVVVGGAAAALWPATVGVAAAPVAAGVLGHGSSFFGSLWAGTSMTVTKVAVAASVTAAGLGVGTHELLDHSKRPVPTSVVAAPAANTGQRIKPARPRRTTPSPASAPTAVVTPQLPTAAVTNSGPEASATPPQASAARSMAIERVDSKPVDHGPMTWQAVSVPVRDAPAGSTLQITSSRTVASRLAVPEESGWSCRAPKRRWSTADYLAETTTDCVYSGEGDGSAVTIEYILGTQALIRGVLTPPEGVEDSSLLDKVADLLLG